MGKYRRQPTIQAQPFMARERHGVKHTHVGHERLVRQEKGSRFMWSQMDHILQQNGLRLTGTNWERSPSVSSYHAEMIGLCALHLFARALSEFYQIQEWEATLCCDNKRALEQSAYTRRRILLEEFAFCTRPYSNASVDRAATPNRCSK